jgi:pilus assembly protein Flp/PilA
MLTGVSVFVRDEAGQGLTEYALIVAVIAIAVIIALVFMRGGIQNIFSNVGNNLTSPNPCAGPQQQGQCP